MATEPVSSDSSTVLEQVEHESPEKVKTIEESVSELKEKEEEIPSGIPVPSSESIEDIAQKESKPPIAEEVVNSNVEEKPQVDESPNLDATSTGPEETKEDKGIEPSPPEDVIVSNVVPVDDVSLLDNKESSSDHVAEVDKGDVSVETDDSMKSEAVPLTENKDLEKLEEETVVDKPEEQANQIDVPEIETKEISKEIEPSESLDAVSTEEVQVKELLEKTQIPVSLLETSNVESEQSNTAIPKETEVSEAKDVESSPADEEKNLDALVSAPGKDLSEEKAKITEELKQESVEAEATEKTEVDAANNEESPVDNVEEIKLKSELEPIEAASTKQTTEEAHVEQKDIEVPPTEALENIDTEDPIQINEESNETEKLATDVKIEEKKDDAVVNEESAVPEAKGIGEVSEAEQTSRDVELPADIEGKKDEVLDTASETNKDPEVEKKVDAEEPQKSGGEDLSEQKAEITEELKESIEAEATDKLDVDAAKDEESLTDKVEGIELKSEVEPIASESSKQDNVDAEDPIKPDETNETEDLSKDLKTEDKKEDTTENEESTVPEGKGISELTSSVPAEAEQTSREIELPADIEVKKDATLGTTAETEKDVEVEKKVDVEEEENASESLEPQVEQQKEVEENAKPDAPIEEAPKEEVPVKQKNSNNLLSKMKQSLVKAKKAITKKTPSKTPPTS